MSDPAEQRRLKLEQLWRELEPDEDRYDEVPAILRGETQCPRYALVTTNGTGSYWITLHACLEDCCEQLVVQMNDDVPYRHREATDLDSGRVHYFKLAATAGPAEEL